MQDKFDLMFDVLFVNATARAITASSSGQLAFAILCSFLAVFSTTPSVFVWLSLSSAEHGWDVL